MKRILTILMILIGFGISVNAQQKENYYRSSYSTLFSCFIRLGGGVERYVACTTGSYERGYEDGYAGKTHQYKVVATSKYVYNATTIVTSFEPADVSAEELSYAVGYKDGEKDRRKEGR